MTRYSMVKDPSGKVYGLWLADPENAQESILSFLLLKEGHSGELETVVKGDYRVVPNPVDDAGGCFVMFGSNSAPGEQTTPTPKKKWWQFR